MASTPTHPRVNPVAAEVHPLVIARYSPTQYADRPIDTATLQRVLEAARWAPSSYNRQPWYFLVTRRGEGKGFPRLLRALSPYNQRWAQTAPVLILGCAQVEDERGPNRYAFHDLGLASGFLALQAVAEGLATRFIAGFDKEAARQAFDIPTPYQPWTVIALGYPAADVDPHAKPRTRKPYAAIVGWDAWGVAPPFAET